MLQGRDCFVLMPTGGGKSLCYQMPALMLNGLTLVVSPMISLMKDQVDALKKNGVAAEFINSSLSFEAIQQVQRDLVQGKVKLLYVAPERLANEYFRGLLENLRLSLIAVDEAHCISQWGHDFRPEYRNLHQLRHHFSDVPVIALTATATQQVRKDILQQLQLNQPQQFIASFKRDNLQIRVVRKRKSFEKLVDLLRSHPKQSCIVYCLSRNTAENLATELSANGFKALPYHAGLEQEVRRLHQEKFIRDEVDIITATVAFGMGIDKPDVRLVVHYNLPKSLEEYYQEIGRAGRDGLLSDCVLFYSYADVRNMEFIFKDISDPLIEKNQRQVLNEMVRYAETQQCRMRQILKYFGENLKEGCGMCDQCLQPVTTFDATIIAQKILSCVMRTENRFGLKQNVDILLGRNTARIREKKHDQLSVFGIVKEFNEDELRQIIHHLIDLNLLKQTIGEYPLLQITTQGVQFIKQRETLQLPQPHKEFKEKAQQAVVESFDLELFERLRSLRKQLAHQDGVAPYVVFGDVTLREMAHFYPVDQANLARIKGIGEAKLKSYAPAFMEEIKKYVQEKQITPKPVERTYTPASIEPVLRLNANAYTTLELVNQRKSLKEMADIEGFKLDTILTHLIKLKEANQPMEIEYLRPESKMFEEVASMLQKHPDQGLKVVFQALEERYSYEEIKLVSLFL